MAAKLTKLKKQRYRDIMNGALMAFGAECTEVNSIGGETWALKTRFGPLELFLHNDCLYYTLHTRFEDAELAFKHVSNVARISGKWNHYIDPWHSPDAAAGMIIDMLQPIVEPTIIRMTCRTCGLCSPEAIAS